jgi:hypothetical protein
MIRQLSREIGVFIPFIITSSSSTGSLNVEKYQELKCVVNETS